ncbi:hypothetical protein BM526_15300 [Alteromonas mediterranea]|uniref:hypothetical protein n=1 Tax=Alteromonas mediterranea TaxID=314275 RepID=UPI000903A7AC|nr:hypothetical protein [Alteromonas mediterranea]APE03094.1 hypothetical protein BM526_15300 [Alteromonas mediterranea]
MKREPRNPDVKFKPAVISWFKKRPEAQSFFDPVRDFLVSYYSGSNYGYINKKAYPEYRFNSAGSNEVYIVLRASQNHTLVRVRISSSKVKSEFGDYHKTIATKVGKRIDVYDFMVAKTRDIKIISDFFRQHEIQNFTAPKFGDWKNFEINESDEYKSIRLQSGETVKVSHEHLKLSKRFIKWLGGNGYKNIRNEYILASQDRIDVIFKLNNKTIFSELKTISGSSTKRAIREALGQILDYQYYNQTHKADELWIVVNDECSDKDVLFIKTLIDKHKLPLRLVWEKNKGFTSFPEL